MICPECDGDGFTHDNEHDMPRHSPSKGGTFEPTWTCWKCKGDGEVRDMITVDKEILASELTNDRMDYMGLNTDPRHWSMAEKEMWDELYEHFIKLIKELEE